MTISKIIRSLSFGFIMGILAIGLLPFIIIFNWAEMLSLTELEATPLFLVANKFINGSWVKNRSEHTNEVLEKEEE